MSNVRRPKSIVIIVIGLLIATAGVIYFSKTKAVAAAWLNDSWRYRKAIIVTNNTSAENNVYVSLSSYDTSDMTRYQPDCGDIRFTKQNGALMRYYIVSGCGTTSTTIHILFDTFAAGEQTIFIYYANASASNGYEGSDFSTAATSASIGSPATEEITSGPIAYWKFDEGVDNSCPGGRNDLCDTKNRHDAVRSGPTRQSEDACVKGQCLYFDGTNDNTVLADNDAFDFAGTDSFTVSGWFRTPPKTSGTYTILSKQQTSLGIGLTAATNIVSGTDDGIGGYDAAWLSRVVYDPNNNRWHVVYSDTGADIHTQSTAATSGTVWTDSGFDINTGTWDYEDFGCSVDTDGPNTYLNCTYAVATTDQLFYKRCTLSGTTPFISCDTEQEVYESSDVGKSNNDDIQSPRIATDKNGCSMILADYQDSTEAAGNQFEVWLWKEAAPCGDGTWTTQSGFPREDIAAASGFNADMGVGIKSYGNLDFQLYWIDTDGGTASSDLETNIFYGETNTLGTERELETAVEYGAQNEFYDSVVFGPRNVAFAADEASTDLDAYVVNTLNGALTTQVDTLLNVPSTTAQYDGYVTAAVDTIASGGDNIWVFAQDPGDNEDIYYNTSTDGGTTWGGSSTLWVNSFDSNELKYFSSAFNRENCDIMVSWLGNFTNVKVDSKIINTGSCTTLVDTGYKLQMESDGDLTFTVSDGTNSDTATSTEATYDDNQWHYYSAVKSGVSSITLYIDGKQVASKDSITATGTLANSNALYTGIGSDGSTSPYAGFLDEVKIYPYARSADEVKADYASRGTAKGVAAQLGDDDLSKKLTDGLVGYWKMDEAIGSTGPALTSLDSSGNGDNGTGAGNVRQDAGKYGNGAVFDGNGDYVNLGSTINLGTQNTVSYWLSYYDSGDAVIIGNVNSQYATYIDGPSSSGSIYYRPDPSSGYVSVVHGGFTAGTWDYITIVRDGPSVTFYRNGQQLGTTQTLDSNYSLVIDCFGASCNSGTFYLDGKLDDIRVYNRVLTPSEVEGLYQYAPGPVGWWKMDENTGTGADAVKDKSGNANHGDMQSSMTQSDWVQGKYGSGLKFDGVDDYVSVTDPGAGSAIDIKTGTWEVWFKINTLASVLGSQGPIIDKYLGTGDQRSYQLVFYTNDNIFMDLDPLGTGTYTRVSSDSALTTNQWYHVAVVADGSQAYMYINGTKQADVENFSSVFDSTADLSFGGESGGNSFAGIIDEVRIYNYARTAEQVIEDMNAGHPSVGSPVGSATAHWKFDEGYGLTANNSGNVGSTANGTLATGSSAPTWTNDGKFGKALSFDGTSDYVSATDDTSLRFDDASSDFSVFAWVKRSVSGAIHYVVSKEDADDDGWRLQIDSGNTITCSTGVTDITSTTTITDTNWHHVGCTIDRGGNGQVYLDAKATGGAVGVGSTAMATTTALNIGSRSYTRTSFFNGTIDEVKIYPFALTADEVKSDYNQGKAIVLGSSSTGVGGTSPSFSASREYCVPGDSTSCSAPVLEFKLDEGAGLTSYDTTGIGSTGTLSAGALWIPAKKGNGVKFDGVTDQIDYNTITQARFSYNDPFSVSVWFIAYSANANYASVVSQQGDSSRFGYDFLIAPSANKLIYFELCKEVVACDAAVSNTAISLNRWYHLNGTFDGTNIKLYVDGVLQTTTDTWSQGVVSDPNRDFRISNDDDASAIDRTLNGIVDDVRVYDYARTPAQVAWEFNKGAPVAQYKLDECEGTTAYNSVRTFNDIPAGNNGTIYIGSGGEDTVGTCTTSSTSWYNGASGKRGASLDFDGTDDYVAIPDVDLFSFGDGTTDRSFSLSAWINMDDATEFPIITKATSATVYEWRLFVSGADTLAFTVYDDSANAHRTRSYSTAITSYENTWAHITATYDGSASVNGLKIYLNGIRVDNTSGSTGSYTAMENISSIVAIGRLVGGDTLGDADGQIDEAKIFNYALTPAQIKTEYNSGAVRFE